MLPGAFMTITADAVLYMMPIAVTERYRRIRRRCQCHIDKTEYFSITRRQQKAIIRYTGAYSPRHASACRR